MKKLKFFSLLAAMLFATSMWATDPRGSVDGLQGKNGSFRIWGWALDPDDGNYNVTIHVYLFTSSTETDLRKSVKGINAGSANISRPDLASMGYGTMHGFDVTLGITDLNPGTYYVRAYALDKEGVNNPNIGYSAGGNVMSMTVSSPYTVSYNANGGSGAPGSQTKCSDITLKLSSTTPTRTGYTFNGWNTNSGGTGTNYAAGANYTANASVTLYAKWTANKYTVTLDRQGGSGGDGSCTATYGSAMPTVNIPGRSGYSFGGYYSQANGGGKQYLKPGTSTTAVSNNNWDIASNSTLYAKWNLNTYTISYDLAGGAIASPNPTSYTVETATFTLNNPTRDGFVFAGWTGSNGSTPQTSVTIAKGSTGNKSYTANWLRTYAATHDASMAEDWQVTSPVGVGQTVTATYSGKKHVKSVSYLGVPDVSAPTAKSDLVYTGSAQALINAGSTTGGTMQYKLGNGDWSTTVPSATNAGTYTVAYRVQGNETYAGDDGGSFNVSIAKANPNVSAPTGKTSLVYNGTAQALANAGSTTGGTMQYKLGNGDWSTTVPSATNAGTYTVAYRVQGNENYDGTDGGSFNVSIAKADPNMSLSVTSLSMTADDFSKDITVTRSGDGAITASSSSTTYAKPTVNGNKVTVHRAHGAATSSNVTITINVAESSNYKSGSKTCTYSQAVLRTPATATSSDKGRFLGIYGYLWKSKADAAYGSEPLVAVVAVVGSCNNYFTKCLCIALEDISSSRLSRADAATALNTWASSHSVNVHGTVYSNDAGGYYDWASSSNYKIRDNSYGVGKGWRLPTVCDWRYIMNSYLGWSLTNPAGVSHGVNPGLGQWSSVRTAINNATGGTAMKTDNNYGSSTRADGNSNIGTWHCGNGDGGNVTWWWANDHDGYKYYYRAVFAY